MLVHSAEAVREAYADQIYVRLSTGVRTPSSTSESHLTELGRSVGSLHSRALAYVLMSWLATLWTTRSCQSTVTPVRYKKNLPEAELAAWREEHAADCCRNHHQSAKSVEQEAAKIMWQRSVEKFCFCCVEMLSDGDSVAYKAVCDIAPYGEKVINKPECVNHAHKHIWALHCGSWRRKSGWDAEEMADWWKTSATACKISAEVPSWTTSRTSTRWDQLCGHHFFTPCLLMPVHINSVQKG